MPTWDDYLTLAFDEIRQFGMSSVQVIRRLRAALTGLAGSTTIAAYAEAARRYSNTSMWSSSVRLSIPRTRSRRCKRTRKGLVSPGSGLTLYSHRCRRGTPERSLLERILDLSARLRLAYWWRVWCRSQPPRPRRAINSDLRLAGLPKDRLTYPGRLLMPQTTAQSGLVDGIIGGGTWEGAQARHEATRIVSLFGGAAATWPGIMRGCLETRKLEQLEAASTRSPAGLPMRRLALRARGPAPMKPIALRIERLLAKVEAALVPPDFARSWSGRICSARTNQSRRLPRCAPTAGH